MGFQKKSKRPAKNRKTKKILVFDESAREDYLRGFRKRKNERRKKAQDEKKVQIKEELKEQKKKRIELLKKSRMYSGKHQNIEQDVKEFIKPEILDLPQHTVTITDISEVDLSGHDGLRLGQNKMIEDQSDDDGTESGVKEKEHVKPLDKKEIKSLLKRKTTRQQHMKKIRHKNYSHAQDRKFKMKHKQCCAGRKIKKK